MEILSKRIFALFILIICAFDLYGQNKVFTASNIETWLDVVKQDFEEEKERLLWEMETAREDMLVQIEQLGYAKERIVGENNEYLELGMSKKWKSKPRELLTEVPRVSGQYRMEKAHVDIFHMDKRYHQLDKILTTLDKVRGDEQKNRSLVASLSNNLNKWSPILGRTSDEMTKALISEALTRKYAKSGMSDWKTSCDRDAIGNIEFTKEYEAYVDMQIRQGKVVSYPYDGQFNFYIHSFKRYMAYHFHSPRGKENQSKNGIVDGVAVWELSSGETFATRIKSASHRQFAMSAFPIPYKWLKPGEIYTLKLYRYTGYGLFEKEEIPTSLEHFMPQVIQQKKSDFELVEQIYFRTSLFPSFFKKILQSSPESNDLDQITIPLSEPLEEPEVNQNLPNRSGLWDYHYSENYELMDVLNGKDIQKYLNIPRIYPVDTNDFLKPNHYDLDHTSNVGFIRSIGGGSGNSSRFSNSYFVKKGENAIVHDSIDSSINIIQSGPLPPRITQSHFKGKPIDIQACSLTTKLEQIHKLSNHFKVVQDAVRIRMEERRNLFYSLYLVQQKRSGEPIEHNRQYFSENELEYMTPLTKKVFEEDFDSFINSSISILPQGGFPGATSKSLYSNPTFKVDRK